MSKSILKILAALLVLLIPVCCICVYNAAFRGDSGSKDADTYDAADLVMALDFAFDMTHSAPDGSTPSMCAHAEAYLEFWGARAEELANISPDLMQNYSAFEASLEITLTDYAEQFRGDDGAPYGSAVSYELIMKRAYSLRDWFAAQALN